MDSIPPPPQTTLISKDADAFWCRRKVLELAIRLGFGKKEQWELSIVVSELCSNIIKFASTGSIIYRPTFGPLGIEIVALDDGPGIDDIDAAVQDGFSEGVFIKEHRHENTRGLGTGLGTIKRMMNEVRIENMEGRGLKITANKYLER